MDQSGPKWTELDQMQQSGPNWQNKTEWETSWTDMDWIRPK